MAASSSPITPRWPGMVAWLVCEGVTHVRMEATGIYWKPIFHALCQAERPLEVLLVNARHVKSVPGRKSDALDAVWLAELTEWGSAARRDTYWWEVLWNPNRRMPCRWASSRGRA